MKKYKVTDIMWDTCDGDIRIKDSIDLPRLPSEVTIHVEDDFDPVEEIVDYLSEDFGWCVESCSFEEIT